MAAINDKLNFRHTDTKLKKSFSSQGRSAESIKKVIFAAKQLTAEEEI